MFSFFKKKFESKMINIDGDGKERELERQIPNLETPQDLTFWLREDSLTRKKNILIVNHRAF